MDAARWIAPLFVGLFFFLAGCSGGGTGPAEPPSGWEATETRMWKTGVDTSMVFRDMQNLSEMGVLGTEFALTSGGISPAQFESAIKRSLMKLYRSNPVLVDTLFERHAAPKLQGADLSSPVEDGKLKPELLNKYKKRALKSIRENYQRPQLKKGISNIAYPDSLRRRDVSGTVTLQMHVDTSGAVDAVEVVNSVHPTLDAIAMKAATRTTWEPAYEMVDREWQPREGWGRSPISFRVP